MILVMELGAALGTALGGGVLAGLAVAAPLGAIGVLLIEEGIQRGVRRGLPAAAAVASVDVLYSAAAVFGGSVAAPLLARWMPWPSAVGGLALLAIAGIGFWRGGSHLGSSATETPAASPAASDAAIGNGWRRFMLFFGVTAINPATLIYFAAIAAGLADLTSNASTEAVLISVAFVAGVGTASFTWQALLVSAGGLLRSRSSPRMRRATAIIGNTVVAGFGVLMVVHAFV